jgi:hypothetical protein
MKHSCTIFHNLSANFVATYVARMNEIFASDIGTKYSMFNTQDTKSNAFGENIFI